MGRTQQRDAAALGIRNRSLRQVREQHQVSAPPQPQTNVGEERLVIRSCRQGFKVKQLIPELVELELAACRAEPGFRLLREGYEPEIVAEFHGDGSADKRRLHGEIQQAAWRA